MNSCTYTNKISNSKRLWIYLQLLFKSLFYFMKLSDMAMVQNVWIMLGQTLNESLCVEFGNFVKCHIFV